jgi:hypothetical protein
MTVQHLAALEHANTIRLARARKRRQVTAMSVELARWHVAELLDDPPVWLGSQSIIGLLRWVPRTGQRIARHELHSWCPGVAENRRVGDMTGRQRAAVAGGLRDVSFDRSSCRVPLVWD